MHDTHGNYVSVRRMLLHQNLKRRDGSAEPGLWRWISGLCLVPVHMQQEKSYIKIITTRETIARLFIFYFSTTPYTFLCSLFLLFPPLISLKASWSLCHLPLTDPPTASCSFPGNPYWSPVQKNLGPIFLLRDVFNRNQSYLLSPGWTLQASI